MSQKLRYGPRFSQHGAGGYRYSESMANEMYEIAAHLGAFSPRKKYKCELAGHAVHLKAAKKKAALGHERHDAEVRMEEALRKVVEILEFHMTDMMQHRPLPGDRQLVNQLAIHNVIYQLRRKCGVSFDAGEYDAPRPMDEKHTHEPDPEDNRPLYEAMARQRAARAKHMRAITDRLIARGKS